MGGLGSSQSVRLPRGDKKIPAWHKWYDLAVWDRIKVNFRATQPERACICQAQDAETGRQCTDPVDEIDHIIPHKGDWNLFCGSVNYENLQGLCRRHHAEKTANELAGNPTAPKKIVAYCMGVPIYGA